VSKTTLFETPKYLFLLMPVNVYRVTSDEQENKQIAWLCDGEWELTAQIDALSKWLEQASLEVPPDTYVADVGFCWRRDAALGGPVLEPAVMRRMADLGMSLFLSEYAGFADEH
jgi:hypothetical protein